MNRDQPLFTIITPTLNASATVEDAVRSAQEQQVPHEHLVMDGGSGDQTLEILSCFPHLTVHSGRDRGLYDAMNRGAFFARGEWLVFLQADDWLPNGALEAFRQAIEENPGADMVTGSAEAVREIGEGIWEVQWSRSIESSKRLSVESIALGEPMLNARAFRKSLFKKRGPFELAYRLASDRDFLLKLAADPPEMSTTPALVYRYRWHEGSLTMNHGNSLSRQLTEENLSIAESHLARATASTRPILQKWHSLQSVQSGLCALEAFDVVWFFRAAARAMRINPLWLASFASAFASALGGYVGRGFETRSELRRKRHRKPFD